MTARPVRTITPPDQLRPAYRLFYTVQTIGTSALATRANKVPPKVRELGSNLEHAGFKDRGGKGSHRNFLHLASNQRITVSGQEGADAQPYQEKEVRVKIELSKGS